MDGYLPWLIGGAALIFIALVVFLPGRSRGSAEAGIGHTASHDAGDSGGDGGGNGGD